MALLARDLMNTDFHTVEPEMSLVDFERLLISERIGGAPVMKGDELVGIVSRSDIIRVLALEQSMAEVEAGAYAHTPDGPPRVPFEEVGDKVGQRMQKLCVRDAMTAVRSQVSPDARLCDVAEQMTKHRVHRILVIDDGKLLGLISRLDLIRRIVDGTLVEAS